MRTTRRIVGTLAAALLLAAALPGCGLDAYFTDMGDGALPGQPAYPEEDKCVCNCEGGGGPVTPVPSGCDAATFGVDDLTGYTWRFTALTLGAPIPDTLGPLLNDTIAGDIDDGKINVLLAVDAEDRAVCAVDGRVGSGTLEGEAYQLQSDASAIGLELLNSGFRTGDKGVLGFPYGALAWTDETETGDPVLVLQELELSGTFGASAETVEDGAMVAALSVEDAARVTLLGMGTFDTLLTGMVGAQPDLDLDGDGTMDAWRFEGTFTAERVELVQ